MSRIYIWIAIGIATIAALALIRKDAVDTYKTKDLVKQQQATITAYEKSQSAGLNLSEGNNVYKRETENIKIPSGGPVFDNTGILRQRARIEAGRAARRSIAEAK